MIAFNKYYNHFNVLSTVLIVVSLVLLIFKGLNFGIDFKGGTLIELRSNDTKINVSTLRDKFSQMNLGCLLYTSPSPRDGLLSRMPSSA